MGAERANPALTAIRWDGMALHLLDQRVLPHETRWLALRSSQQVAQAITDMVVRGAPAIAITAAYGLAIAVQNGESRTEAAQRLAAARPTAVNLRWALERLAPLSDHEIVAEAVEIHAEDTRINQALGQTGARHLVDTLQPDGPMGLLTICNTGALATGGHGTALGIVRSLMERGQAVHVFVLETRPYLQGARLTAYECAQDNIPYTLVTDSMIAALLARPPGGVPAVQAFVAGCDRVAGNGDAANKIGTHQAALVCAKFAIPTIVAMPTSTLDLRCATGADIAWNPAFDVTPAALIAGWATERGMWRPEPSLESP